MNQKITEISDCPSIFGGIGLLDGTPRRSSAVATFGGGVTRVACIRRDDLVDKIPPSISLKLFLQVGSTVNSLLSGADIYRNQDVLLIQDGGCSPGYDSVTAFLAEEFERRGRRVTVAATGYKSLVEGRDEDFHVLIHNENFFRLISLAPGVIHAPSLLQRRGASFRTERFAEFKDEALQKRAAAVIVERHVKVVVAIGGNGTFAGVNSLSRFLPPDVQVFFIPVTIDSDVGGTETIGQHTAVESGAEKIRCYVADAHTHHRAYFLEMMGRDGGFHTLYSALGGGAHLALMPHSKPDLPALAEIITRRKSTVVAVSEGYCREERAAEKFSGSASDYLLKQLRATGKLNEKIRRVVCEPFSRDIRGASTNNSDLVLSRKMAVLVAQFASEGKSHLMPSVCSGMTGSVPFAKVVTDNTVNAEDEKLANRLTL